MLEQKELSKRIQELSRQLSDHEFRLDIRSIPEEERGLFVLGITKGLGLAVHWLMEEATKLEGPQISKDTVLH